MIAVPEVHEKIWGRELWLVNTPMYCGKILELKAGWQCSKHYHKIKDETFYVREGRVFMEIWNDNGWTGFVMTSGQTIHLPPGVIHRFSGIEDAEILEISTQHLEDDSYRLTSSGPWTGKQEDEREAPTLRRT